MASSSPPETPLSIWASLSRLRDISRLVLAAIERDDLKEIERLSREGNALVKVVQPVLERMRAESSITEDMGSQLEALQASYEAIMGGLEKRRDMLAGELADLRRCRAHLKRVGLRRDPGPSLFNRTT